MLVIFVHGWSVRDTGTYGGLPRWIEQLGKSGRLDVQVGNIYLGRYISFDDQVTLDDIARAFDQAIRDELSGSLKAGEKFACITHSTGGPVVRLWMDLYYRDRLDQCPLSHLIMLAPANHGSALAQLGKSRLSRIKHFFQGVEPGQRVLDWLELGSDESSMTTALARGFTASS
jgi:triacylglycerol esterase/lipase EstA (alpha/beta hydrolase family)